LLILAVGTLSQAQRYYLRRSDARQMLDIIRTNPELFDEVFAAQETADNENFALRFPSGFTKQFQMMMTQVKKH